MEMDYWYHVVGATFEEKVQIEVDRHDAEVAEAEAADAKAYEKQLVG